MLRPTGTIKGLHDQSEFLNTLPLLLRYKLVDGQVEERAEQEIQADRDAVPPPQPTSEERLAALESAMLDMMGGIPSV
ncbi:MAG: hypothetical protein ACOX7N_08490 [Lawsonibacter sp.]